MRDEGYLQSSITSLAYTLTSLDLVSIDFGTAVPTFFYIVEKCFELV